MFSVHSKKGIKLKISGMAFVKLVWLQNIRSKMEEMESGNGI